METITIDKLPEVKELANGDLIPINQENVTKHVQFKKISDFIHENTMEAVNELIEDEENTRLQGDQDTLDLAKEYTDDEIRKNKLAVNEWLAPVRTVSQIPLTGLDNNRNYLIKVVAEPNKSGVYQAVAGWTTTPNWVLYDDTVDFVDEQELEAAIQVHGTDTSAHADLREVVEKISEDYISETDFEDAVSTIELKIEQLADDAVRRDDMGVADGVATLGADGKVPLAQLPAVAGGSGIEEAPNDGNMYGRKNEAWKEIELTGFDTVIEGINNSITEIKQASKVDMVDGMGRDLRIVLGITSIDPAVYIPQIMAEIRRRCNNNGEIDASGIPDFTGLEIGDYIDGLDLSGTTSAPGSTAPQAWNDTYKNNRLEVAGFNTFKGSGYAETTQNHILIVFRNVLCQGYMNSTNVNAGGYPATAMRTWLEGSTGDGSGALATRLKAALGGNFLLTIRQLLSNKGNWAWVNTTLFLPSEINVFGSNIWGESYNDGLAVHFPIYQKSTVRRVKRLNGVRQWYWESTPNTVNAAYFAHVGSIGEAISSTASDATGGVSPAFCVA